MAHRGFVDSDQVAWTVWEIHSRDSIAGLRVRPELAGGWLAFQCRGERRRLSPIPEAWTMLSEAELERLCRMADVTPYHRAAAFGPRGRLTPSRR